MLDRGMVVYLDDILIYMETLADHKPLVQEVLCRPKTNRLQANLKESVFDTQEVEFVGLMVTAKGLRMSDQKIEAVKSWTVSRTFKGSWGWAMEMVRSMRKGLRRYEETILRSTYSRLFPIRTIHGA